MMDFPRTRPLPSDLDRRPRAPLVPEAIRILTLVGFVALFFLSGVDKLTHLAGFYLAVRHYAMVPQAAAPTITYFIPLLELWAAVGLSFHGLRRIAVIAAISMLLTFTAALGINYLLGISAPCGCMLSITLNDATAPHIAFDLLLVFLCLTLWSDAAAPLSQVARHVSAPEVAP